MKNHRRKAMLYVAALKAKTEIKPRKPRRGEITMEAK